MRLLSILAACACFGFAICQTTAPTSQTSDSMNGWGAYSPYNRLYNPKTEVTITGKVTGVVDTQAPSTGMTPVTSVLLKTSNGGVATVDLGPTWFLSHQKPAVKLNERLKVTGSKVFVDNRSVILARKVIRGNRVAYLRELDGFPMWVAGRAPAPISQQVAVASAPSTRAMPNSADSAAGPVPIASGGPKMTAPTQVASTQPTQTLRGTLNQTINAVNPQTGAMDTYALITTPQGVVQVDLGPQWFIQPQGFNWTPGGQAMIEAMPATIPSISGGPPIYFANGMTYANQLMVFRNVNGTPVWSPFGP